MLRATRVAIAVLIGCLLVAQAQADEQKTFTYKKTKDTELTLKAYFPAGWQTADSRPAIVFFFGGGWTQGTMAQFDSQSKHLASRGMVACCADYRVKSRHGVSPEVCVEDAKSAIRWVRQNAALLGVDPQRIVGAGGSAGGHLAACTALCPGFEAADEDAGISSVPNVLVLFNPVLNVDSPKLLERVRNDQKLAQAISPTQHVTATAPPTLILFGTADPLLADAELFVKRAEEAQVKAELYLAQGMGHGFFNKPPWLEKTTKRADTFLVSVGYLQPLQKSGQE